MSHKHLVLVLFLAGACTSDLSGGEVTAPPPSQTSSLPGCTDVDGDGYFFGTDCGDEPRDCHDHDANVHPGAVEVCNGVDDDCNGAVDDEPTDCGECSVCVTLEASCSGGDDVCSSSYECQEFKDEESCGATTGECVTDADCPADSIVESECGGFADVCDMSGTMTRTTTDWSCNSNQVCEVEVTQQTGLSCANPQGNTDGLNCDDGLFCNGTARCWNGSCQTHPALPCGGANGDGNCSNQCDEATDSCTAPDPEGSSCGQDMICEEQMCVYDVCVETPPAHLCCWTYEQFLEYAHCLSNEAIPVGFVCHPEDNPDHYLTYRSTPMNVDLGMCEDYCAEFPNEPFCNLY